MKHGFEHCPGARAWSVGWYNNNRLHVMTLAELIHTVKHTDLHLYLRQNLPANFGGQCRIFQPLLSVTSHPYLALGTHCKPAAHEWACVIDSDPRFICVRERMRQSEETDTSAVREALLSELTSHPHWFNTLLHCLTPPLPSGSCIHHIYAVYIISFKRSPFIVDSKFH